MMFILLILSVAGVLWLSNRFKLLLRLPIDASVRSLLISVPTVPLLSVNKITDTSILLHWDSYIESPPSEKKDFKGDDLPMLPQIQSHSISHFILYINGLQASVINGRQQSCTLEKLKPGTVYQIDLVAFNVSGYRSRSSSVFVKTAASKFKPHVVKDEGMDYPDSIMKALLSDEERKSIVKVDVFRGASPLRRSRSGTVGDSPDRKPLETENIDKALVQYSKTLPHLTSDINELKWMLESALSEYNSLLKSSHEASIEFTEEEANLLATRNEAKERRKYEDTSRASLRQEIKLLEEQKLKGKNRHSKDEKKLEEKKLKIEQQKMEIEKWEVQINEMKKKQSDFEFQQPILIQQYKNDIEQLNKDIFTLISESHDIEEDLKVVINSRKQLEIVKKKLSALIQQLPPCLNTNTGLFNADGIEIIESIAKLFPEWAEELRDELIIKDQDIFNLWKNSEDELIRKINSVQDKQHGLEQFHNKYSVNMASQALPQAQSQSQSQTQPPAPATTRVNSLGHIMRPSLSNSTSFSNSNINTTGGATLGFTVSPEMKLAQLDVQLDSSHRRIPSNNSWSNDVWSNGNQGLASLNTLSTEQPDVNLLLPQTFIGEGINLFGSASLAPTQGVLNGSPNLSQIGGFDYNTNGSAANFINTPQQGNRVTSLTALTNSAKNLMHKKSSIELMRSPPNSIHGPLNTDGYVPALLENLQTSPFNSSQPTHVTSTGGDQWGLINNNSFSYVDSNLSSHYPTESSGRPRSSSNRTIWSNNNSIVTGNGVNNIHNILGGPITNNGGNDQYLYPQTPPQAQHELDQNIELEEHVTSPFSLKNKLFKFGMSPSKVSSNKTPDDDFDDIHTHRATKSTSSSTISQSSSGFLTNGLTTTSRFFKKHRLSTGAVFPIVNETPLDEETEEQNNFDSINNTNNNNNSNNNNKAEVSNNNKTEVGGLRRLSLFGKTDKK